MSAKLLKSLAKGACTVKNRITGEVIVYWPDAETGEPKNLVIRQGVQVDLTKFASIQQLRKSQNLKRLVSEGHLAVIS